MTKKYLITVGLLGIFYTVMLILNVQVFIGRLSPASQSQYDLALSVHLLHTIAILSMVFMNRYLSRAYLRTIFFLFVAGLLVFSGSLYLVSLQVITGLIIGFLNYLAILGALILMAGWIMIMFTGFTYKHKKRSIQNQS